MEPAGTTASDIRADDWVARLVPRAAQPYLRLARVDRPIGIWILVFPCWCSLALASPGLAEPWEILGLAALFLAGAVVMRGAGCTFNDIIDRDIDARVARTRTRPIPSGAVTVPQALVFLGFELAVGLGIVAAFNRFTVLLAVAALPLVAAYPFMKRITDIPQAWLGLTMTWGALLGYAAATGTLAPEAWLLYAALFFWTLGYDTIYAYADKADDLAAGARSLPLKLGEWAKPWFYGVYVVAVALIAAAGYVAGLGWAFWPMLAAAYAQLLWQVCRVDLDDPADCLDKFRSNRLFLALVLAAIVAGQIGRAP
ncbi:MAG TPA: 4-hydroxybenzoate octaprenyltransferase [Alphaproteobacteria bacterium]